MAKAKTKAPRYVTPLGVAVFPYLIKPDTEYNPDGDYKVGLRVAPDTPMRTSKGAPAGTIQEFLDAKLEAAVEEAKKNNKGRIKEADAPYKIDEETGDLIVTFKLKAKGKTKDGEEFTQKPALFDAKGKPFKGESIWGGSQIKVSFEAVPFYTKLIGAGITLRMKGVQVIELVAGGGADAGAYGFGEEEGYEGSEEDGSDFNDESYDDGEDGDEDEGDF